MGQSKSVTALNFMANDAGIDQGLGNAIQIFRDFPYASVARECGQNSADARVESPVIVSFDMLEIKAKELPSLDSFRSSISCCLAKVEKGNSEKDVAFFSNAVDALARETIKVLKISDKNTTGLVGPCRDRTPFFSLVKGEGVSIKQNDTSGGSFGIGKNAAFAISDIQTVFYSTRYVDQQSGAEQFLCQGKAVLVSHTDMNNEAKLATGWWGCPSFMPVERPDDVPEWLRRPEIGTSIFSIACRESLNWEAGLTASLIQNFICAIFRGEMVFSVNNESTSITRESLETLLSDPSVIRAAADSGHEEDFEFAKALFDCLQAVEAKEEIIAIPGIGAIRLRILVRDGLPKRVSIARNGMHITDNLENFGEKFRRFPMYKDFVALVEPIEHEAVAFFRNLENPQHDGFSAERLANSGERSAAAFAMKLLAKEIRDAIKSQSLEKPSDSVVINELSEFFADQVNPDKLSDPNAGEDDPEKFTYQPTKRPPPKPNGSANETDGDEGGSGHNGGDGGNSGGDGDGTGDGSGGTGSSSGGKSIQLHAARNVFVDEGCKKRRLFLTPGETARASVAVLATGVNNAEPLQITDSDVGEVVSGSVVVNFSEDAKLVLTVAFSEEYDGPIEVYATSIGAGSKA